MQKKINFYQEMASEHRLQEYIKGPVPICACEKEIQRDYIDIRKTGINVALCSIPIVTPHNKVNNIKNL